MRNAKNKNKLVTAMILASMLVQPLAGMSVYADEPVTTAETSASEIQDDTSYTLNSLDDMANLMVSLTYADYLADYANVPDTTKEIDIDVTKYNNDLSEGEIEVNEKDTVVRDGKEIVAGTVSTTDEGKLVYDIDVPETAMYSVTVEYYPIAGNGSTIERILLIDDKIPFNEARYMNFTRACGSTKRRAAIPELNAPLSSISTKTKCVRSKRKLPNGAPRR